MTGQYIIFSVAGASYALPTDQIAHVEMVNAITRVPNAPRFVDGVVFSRGEVVPAISLRTRFGFERAPHDVRTRLLVVRSGERMVGLIVDSAREFLAIPESAIKPPNESITGLSGEYLHGIATVGDRMIIVLDLDAVLNATEDSLITASAVASPQLQERR
jgi:purine-binding chemotaxis protein CheW